MKTGFIVNSYLRALTQGEFTRLGVVAKISTNAVRSKAAAGFFLGRTPCACRNGKEMRMSEAQDVSCVQTARGPLVAVPAPEVSESETPSKEVKMTARVGKPAPDFEAMAHHKGSFKKVKLSDFEGQWRLLCFYPGDFTFV